MVGTEVLNCSYIFIVCVMKSEKRNNSYEQNDMNGN